jgi:hypothetical protein
MKLIIELLKSEEERAENLATALGFNDFRPGRHVLRDERNWKSGEIDVARTWVGFRIPSFIATTAVMRFDITTHKQKDKEQGAYRLTGICDFDRNSAEPKNLRTHREALGEDAVINLLTTPPLNNQEWRLTLDGIGYILAVQTMTLNSVITFYNPKEQSLVKLIEELEKLMEQPNTQLSQL